MQILRATIFCLTACFVVGCGGGARGGGMSADAVPAVGAAVQNGTASPSVAAVGSATNAPSSVQVRLRFLPPGATQSTSPRDTAALTRRKQYLAATTTSLTISVTPFGGATTTFGPTSCTGGACAVAFTTVPGPTKLTFAYTDGASTLSRFDTVAIVQPNTLNTLNFTANPVVASVTPVPAVSSVNAGTQSDVALSVNAADADGNVIVGNAPYVDANGNPVSFSLSVANKQAGGRGTVSLRGPSRISAPGQAQIYARYDGNWLDSATISVNSTSSAISGGSTTLATVPTVVEYSAGLTGGASLSGITPGPDGALWFTETAKNKIGRITTSGNITEYAPGFSGGTPVGILTGPDGVLWVAENVGTGKIARVSPQGALLSETIGGSNNRELTLGPDGAVWAGEQSNVSVDRFGPAGATVTYYSSGTANTVGITRGPDGNIWYANHNANLIGRMTPLGVRTLFPVTGKPHFITSGPDGNLWFTQNGGNCVGRMSIAGSVSYFCGSASVTNQAGIVTGPDGNIWYTECNTAKIARVVPGSSTVSEYANGISSGSYPYNLTVGPDGNLWFVEQSGNRIGKFVL